MSKNIVPTLGAVFVGTSIAGMYVLFLLPPAHITETDRWTQTHRCCMYSSVNVFQTVPKRQRFHEIHGESLPGRVILRQRSIPNRCSLSGPCFPNVTATSHL